MAEQPPRQGWRVPERAPLLAAVGVIAFVAALLAIAGVAYWRLLGSTREAPIETFPAPGVETFIHDGQGDPPRPQPSATPDPAIEAAKRAVVADGIAGWSR